jgi:hypothetical protein
MSILAGGRKIPLSAFAPELPTSAFFEKSRNFQGTARHNEVAPQSPATAPRRFSVRKSARAVRLISRARLRHD